MVLKTPIIGILWVNYTLTGTIYQQAAIFDTARFVSFSDHRLTSPVIFAILAAVIYARNRTGDPHTTANRNQ